MATAWTACIGAAAMALATTLAMDAAAQPGEVIPFSKAPPGVLPPGVIPSPPPAPPQTPPSQAGPSAAGDSAPICAPARLTRLVVRNISPNLQASAPAAQPRLLYRQGSTQLRSEESPDPGRNVHAIVVVSEPNVWTMNMVTRTGQHTLDPGPDLNVHAPILPMGMGIPAEMMGLEYGCEMEFVAKSAPQPRQVIPWGAERALVHTVAAGDHALSILVNERRRAPLMIVYARGGSPVFAVRYDEWRADLPDRPALFEPPKNVTFTEGASARPPALKPNT